MVSQHIQQMVHAGYFSVFTICTVTGDDVHCFTIYTVNEEDSYDLNFMQKCMLSNLLLFDLC